VGCFLDFQAKNPKIIVPEFIKLVSWKLYSLVT
jgi:hypothetical protein